MDVGRRGLRLARQAVHELGRDGECAVAFSLNGDVDSDEAVETIRLLARLFADEPEPPDLILLETLSLLTPVARRRDRGAAGAPACPVWLSFRRCRHGLCGIYGQHWGGPEGDAFGRAARRFEEMGAAALLINCIPPDHVAGMVSYLRDFTDLPLGVYPNLGYYSDRGWRFTPGVGGEEYAEMALRWREEGAQIVGGCCGVRPEHIAAAARAAARARRPATGARPSDAQRRPQRRGRRRARRRARRRGPTAAGARCTRCRSPTSASSPACAAPGAASYMAWRYVFSEGIGAHQRCLDIGCGTGILAVQLALNGAAHVRALDIDDRAVANTLANAFRNDVADRRHGADRRPLPVGARRALRGHRRQPLPEAHRSRSRRVSSHRLPDYWGRNLVDQLIAKLSEALAPEGVAYVVQLSILSQRHTADALAARGFVAQVVDYTLFSFPPEQEESRAQIGRVEELSDAYHLTVGEEQVMVAYLLEVRHAP